MVIKNFQKANWKWFAAWRFLKKKCVKTLWLTKPTPNMSCIIKHHHFHYSSPIKSCKLGVWATMESSTSPIKSCQLFVVTISLSHCQQALISIPQVLQFGSNSASWPITNSLRSFHLPMWPTGFVWEPTPWLQKRALEVEWPDNSLVGQWFDSHRLCLVLTCSSASY